MLGENLVSKVNVPYFAKSPLDGFCFMSSDTQNANKNNPVIFKVIEEVPCGFVAKNEITTGKAIKILTGAKIPKGADCICPFEITEFDGDNLKVYNQFKKNQNIIQIGEDIKIGDVFAKRGNVVDVGVVGMLSSLNMNEIIVYKKL